MRRRIARPPEQAAHRSRDVLPRRAAAVLLVLLCPAMRAATAAPGAAAAAAKTPAAGAAPATDAPAGEAPAAGAESAPGPLPLHAIPGEAEAVEARVARIPDPSTVEPVLVDARRSMTEVERTVAALDLERRG